MLCINTDYSCGVVSVTFMYCVRHSCNEMWIRNRTQTIEWHHFKWHLTRISRWSHYSTLNISDTVWHRPCNSDNGMPIKTRMQSVEWEWCHFQQPLVTSNVDFKHENSNRQSYTILIVSRIWSIARCHFQWPWTTHNPDLKMTTIFDAACVSDGTRCIFMPTIDNK